MKTKLLPSAILLFIICFFSGCGPSDKSKEDTFSSPKTLFVEYVSSYTSGIVSKSSTIKIQLAKAVPNAKPGEELKEEVFDFDPKISGKAIWEDKRTISFLPANSLGNGKLYKTVFYLDKIIDVPSTKKEFKFTFKCIPQNFDLKMKGIALYDAKDIKRVKWTGIIQTADVVAKDDIEKVLQASQHGDALKIHFSHEKGSKIHEFTIENIQRTDDPGEVELQWDGTPIGVDKKGKKSIKIPSLSDFSITSVSVNQLGEKYISVKFSDPLNSHQNLRGLVMLSQGTAPRVVVHLNELKIYATSKLEGNVTLTIDKSIKNASGYGLKKDYSSDIQFSQQKPDVRIIANKGVIMPSSEGLIVPFEAVGLSAVDMTIVRIFENNILQYLQVNDPGDDYQLERVGRPVARKTLQLSSLGATNLNEWSRFSVDLSEYIKVEPGAFYQVRLRFRPSQSLYFCPGSEIKESASADNYDYEESSNWDFYESGYYDYDWRERDNPCNKSYYIHHGGAQKMVFASDLGLLAKQADHGDITVFVTNIINTAPLANVDVQVYDYQQQEIGGGKTDKDGKTLIKITQKPYILVARSDDQVGYLKVDKGSALSMSNFNISGNKIQKGLKGFVFGERGVWRPADTLHLSFILEDAEQHLPPSTPVILELYNPVGQLFKRQVQSGSLKGIYTFSPVTPADAPTGNWQAKVKVGGASFTKRIKIETVKPNRLKINLTFDKDKLYNQPGGQYANLDVRWLQGGVAHNLKTSYEVLLKPVKTIFKKYEDVTFDDPSKQYITESSPVFEGRLDNDGKARIPFKLAVGDEAPGMMKAVFRGKVFEEGGDFSIDNTSVPFVPYSSFAGIKVPEGDKRGMLVTDTDHNVRIVSVDAYGKPINRSLKVMLYKLKWRWWWDNSWENKSNYTSSYYSKLISTVNINTRQGEGIYKLRVNNPEWGRFLIRVKDPVSGHSCGKIVYIDWPGWAGKQKNGAMGGAMVLDFSVEKENVKVGDYIKINIPSSAGGRALVSLETGSRILQTFWVDSKQDNTVVQFEATPDMAPNIYANITLLQPHAQTANDLPIRMYGVKAIGVTDPETVLKPELEMPNELRSEQSFDIAIREKNEKPMAYTVAIVEDGLLDLTKYKTPKPWGTFYAREALGINTWDLYDDVMGSYGGALEAMMGVGGDDEIKAPDSKKANRFKPVVMFKGPFFAKAGEKKIHHFKLPQYIGSVRVMVVAGYDGAYGSADKTVPVKQPLMVLATLPRVAGPTEQVSLPVNIFTMDDKIKDVDVAVSTQGNLKISGKANEKIHFAAQGDKVVYFNLKASESLGIGKVHVEATAGSHKAAYDVELQVRASNPSLNQVTENLLEGNQQMTINYAPVGLSSTNEGILEISSLPPLNLEQRLSYLIRYPHGCIEQTTSSVFAQLYLPQLIKVDDSRAATIQKNINAAIARLRSFQLTDGGFSYWPGRSEPSMWGTNYAGHFLIEAQKQGYHVPEDIISKWLAYQQEQANNWNAVLYKDYHVQAYRLYGLALAGFPAMGAMNRLKGRDTLPNVSRWTLACAYAIAGYPDEAKEMIEDVSKEVKQYRGLGRTFGSTQRDQAMILEALVRLDMKTDAFEMIKRLSEKMGDSKYWMSTQTTAYCLIGIAEFSKKYPPESGINVAVNIDGNDFRIDGTKYLNQVTLINPDKPAGIEVKNNGENPLFVRLIRQGVPLEGNEEAAESNVKLQVQYKAMDGSLLDVASLKQGTDFVAEVTVTNPGMRGDYTELALTQIFPSGWEILNNRLDDTDQLTRDVKPTYQDIRDDRVMSYFDLAKNTRITLKVYLNAAYLGAFYMPAVYAGAMYDNAVSANTKGQWVKVVK